MANEKLYVKMQEEVAALASSINDIVTKFRSLQNPLTESHDRVPQATEQLDKISAQTEAAAHQMLDRIEGITQREEEVMDGLIRIKELVSENKVAEIPGLVDDLHEKANTSCNDAFLIMDALQFQDITAQQMDHAASLLEDVQTRLGQIMSVISGQDSTGEDETEGKPSKTRAFDPHADLGDKQTLQADIDNLFAKKK